MGIPTLEEVARAAGVSRATASRVVNGSPTVGQGARQAVNLAIDQLGYVPNIIALSTHPPLSSVRQSMEQMGRELVNVLLQLAASPEAVVRHVVLETQLVVRESSAVGPMQRNGRSGGPISFQADLPEAVGEL